MYRSTFSSRRHKFEVSDQIRDRAAVRPVPTGGPQSRSGRRGGKKILDLTWTRIPTPQQSSLQPVAIPTELSAFVGFLVRAGKWENKI
jgi:hypothetical protein